jgi:predicted RNase H-like HicB family nuclease
MVVTHQNGAMLTGKKERFMVKCQFTIVLEPQPEGGYLVSVPALPGCYTEGRTLEEAWFMAADAIRAYCESLAKHGETIPQEAQDQLVGRVSVVLEATA